MRYDWAADAVAAGYPHAISDDWPGLFASAIDAVVLLASGNAYFFQGSDYFTWSTPSGAVDGAASAITDGWSGLFDSAIEAALLWPTGNLYFFRNGEYAKYDLDADAVATGYPRQYRGTGPGCRSQVVLSRRRPPRLRHPATGARRVH